MELSRDLKSRFCKDNNLSIQIFDEPYFSERLRLFGFDCEYDSFCDFITTKFDGNEQSYLQEYNKIKDEIINHITNSSAYKHLNEANMNDYSVTNFPNVNMNGNIYKIPNVGKEFVSIDITKANFSALVHYAKETNTEFFDSYDFEKFMELFTNILHIRKSKYIRQVVFGKCNPKRQITYEKYLICNFLENLLSTLSLDKNCVSVICSDEIVLDVTNFDIDTIKKIKEFVVKHNEDKSSNNIPLHFEYFMLGKILNTNAFIKKAYNDLDNKDIFEYVEKCAAPIEIPFIYRKLNNEEMNENDSVFYYEHKLAKLLEPLKVEISFNNN